jgi:hypothetical protein
LRTGFTWENETEVIEDNGFAGEVQERFDSATGQPDFTVPWRVILENSPRTATNNIAHSGAFIQDQFVLNEHLTINAGLRWDYYRVHYPEHLIREGRFRDFFYAGAALPNGYSIPASFPSFTTPGNDSVIRFPSGFGPRAGVAYDIAGDGKTVVKANWGRYQSNPGPQNFTNPNQRITYTFQWNDRNADRRFQIEEVGNFVSSAGGVSDSISPDLKQEYTDDVSVFLEREIIANLGARVGYVKKIGKNNWQETQVGRQYAAYTDRRTFNDAGPDGLAGTADDGAPFVAFDYPAGVTIPASRTNLRNEPLIESWDQNIDLTISKRLSNRWSLLSSFLYNWDHDKGAPQTPNAERFNETDLTNWSFKVFGTYQAPWSIAINPVLRYQQGVNLSRLVRVSLRTGNFDYEAEGPGSYRSENVAIFDLAGERRFRLPGNRSVDLFIAAFNMFNANPATTMDETIGRRTATLPDGERVSYARFLRPSAVLPPRVFRLGFKLAF